MPEDVDRVTVPSMAEALDRRERRELCDLFLELGPDAPTLCAGWSAIDLATHLVVRERSVRGAPGIVLGEKIKKLGEATAAAQAREAAKGFEAVVERVRSGPPLTTRLLSPLINLNEYAIHHEDLRRANGMTARTDRPDLQDGLWRSLKRGVRLIPGRPKKIGLVLARPDGTTIVSGQEPAARIAGEPMEIVLYLFGRGAHADVAITGDPEAVEAYRAAKLGL
jgi:uncharacterized protein (TIGR03085 family)